jgi:hypothetical protein
LKIISSFAETNILLKGDLYKKYYFVLCFLAVELYRMGTISQQSCEEQLGRPTVDIGPHRESGQGPHWGPGQAMTTPQAGLCHTVPAQLPHWGKEVKTPAQGLTVLEVPS